MTEKFHIYDLIKESFLLLDFGDRLFLEQYELSVPRYYALTHIAAEPGISPSLLSRYMFCDKSNITRLTQGLQSDGLVERKPHEHDGRSQRLYLTPEGERLHNRVAQAHRRYVESRLAAMADCTAAEIEEALSHLIHNLSETMGETDATLLAN
jgi:DNA-binding MarR family transcriptional regulator